MPPAHFSIFIVQRGTMHICCIVGVMPGAPAIDIDPPIDPIIDLSIIMTLVIACTPLGWPAINQSAKPRMAARCWKRQARDEPLVVPVSRSQSHWKQASRLSGQHKNPLRLPGV